MASMKCFGPNPQTERGTATKINASKDGSKLVYANGSTVIVRDVKNPEICQAYTEHKHEVSVAKFSPNGNYIASGDAGGSVKLWAYTHPEFLLKKETPVLAGKVLDIDFDPEGKRMVACGDGGKAFHAKAFMAESGSALGEISGPTKALLCASYRPKSPFRIAVGGQDFKVAMFQGPPFKFLRTHDVHTNFVQAVQYSPNGDLLASASSDKKVVIYDGESGDIKIELPVEHTGSVFGCAWHSSEAGKLMTVSGDKTVKLWDINAGKCVTTIKMDTRVSGPDAMQVGGTYAGNTPISLALNGDLSYIDFSSGSVQKVVEAHTTTPSRIVCDWEAPNPCLYVGTKAGNLTTYDGEGKGRHVQGEAHNGYVSGLTASKGKAYSVGWDDSLRSIVGSSDGPAKIESSNGLEGQPRDVSTAAKDNSLVAICKSSSVELQRDGNTTATLSTPFEATCVAMSPEATQIAIGSAEKAVHIYNVTGGGTGLEDTGIKCEGLQSAASCLAYSPNGKWLAVGDRMKEITLWDASASYVNKIKNKWVFHQSTINGVSFSPDSQYVASASIDTHIYVWNVDKAMKKTKIAFAHPGGAQGVAWADGGILYSCGEDGCVRKWKPDLPQ